MSESKSKPKGGRPSMPSGNLPKRPPAGRSASTTQPKPSSGRPTTTTSSTAPLSTPYEIEEPESTEPVILPTPDINLTLNLTLLQSLTGFKRIITFKHLNGRKLHVEKTGVTKHGGEDVYPGLGNWKDEKRGEIGGTERGDLVVKYTVKFPERLTGKQRTKLIEIL
jgi:hypothetical protein